MGNKACTVAEVTQARHPQKNVSHPSFSRVTICFVAAETTHQIQFAVFCVLCFWKKIQGGGARSGSRSRSYEPVCLVAAEGGLARFNRNTKTQEPTFAKGGPATNVGWGGAIGDVCCVEAHVRGSVILRHRRVLLLMAKLKNRLPAPPCPRFVMSTQVPRHAETRDSIA